MSHYRYRVENTEQKLHQLLHGTSKARACRTNLLPGEASHKHRPETGQERRSIRRGAVGILADETESNGSGGIGLSM